ncbi:MAG: hypothetical protein IJM09_07105, partial [Neisseriaceae bacterium]|nr:hypothetical protein [Neisseriaceae bacterium]
MKRFLSVLALGLAFALPAAADSEGVRELPQDMEVAYLESAQYPTVKLSSGGFSWVKWLTFGLADNSQTFQMTRATKIRDQRNTFIPSGKLQFHHDKFVAFKRGAGLGNTRLQEIWILNDYEVDSFRQKAEEQAQVKQALQEQIDTYNASLNAIPSDEVLEAGLESEIFNVEQVTNYKQTRALLGGLVQSLEANKASLEATEKLYGGLLQIKAGIEKEDGLLAGANALAVGIDQVNSGANNLVAGIN